MSPNTVPPQMKHGEASPSSAQLSPWLAERVEVFGVVAGELTAEEVVVTVALLTLVCRGSTGTGST